MPKRVQVEDEQIKSLGRAFERYIHNANEHLKTAFKNHPEIRSSNTGILMQEHVLDMSQVAKLYSDLGLGNIHENVKRRMSEVPPAPEQTLGSSLDQRVDQPRPQQFDGPPTEADILGLANR